MRSIAGGTIFNAQNQPATDMASHLVSKFSYYVFVTRILTIILRRISLELNRIVSIALFITRYVVLQSFELFETLAKWLLHRLVHAVTATDAHESTSDRLFLKRFSFRTFITTLLTTPSASSLRRNYKKASTRSMRISTANWRSLVIFWSYT